MNAQSDLRIASVEPFILHAPVTRSSIADSTHSLTHWGVVGCRIITNTGIIGFGYTGTHADLTSVDDRCEYFRFAKRLACGLTTRFRLRDQTMRRERSQTRG